MKLNKYCLENKNKPPTIPAETPQREVQLCTIGGAQN